MSSVKTPKTGRRWVTVVGAILATTAMTLSLGASASATPGPASPCKAVSFPVTLEHSPQAQTIAGRLCGPRNTKVQVLVPGYTYNSTYWDFGYRPETYSYARYAVARGQSVLLIDRLGTGRSSKPDALWLTLFEHAHTLAVVGGLDSERRETRILLLEGDLQRVLVLQRCEKIFGHDGNSFEFLGMVSAAGVAACPT